MPADSLLCDPGQQSLLVPPVNRKPELSLGSSEVRAVVAVNVGWDTPSTGKPLEGQNKRVHIKGVYTFRVNRARDHANK